MLIYITIYKSGLVRIRSLEPLIGHHLPGSHCFSCSDLLSLGTLSSFLASAIAYINAGNIQFVTIEGFTLIY